MNSTKIKEMNEQEKRQTMSRNVIEMNGIGKTYRKDPVLCNLSMNVPEGSIYAYLGKNGAGKTTTIQLLMNFLKSDRGTIKIFGKDSVKDSNFIRSKIGYVPEIPFLYDWMRIDEIIEFTSKFYKDWNHKRADELLLSLSLPPKKKIGELSLGTKAKLGLLLALSHDPKLLILDDSTSGLDVNVRREFLEHIVTLVEDQSHTIFFSSHIITELERVSDHVALLKDGSLAFEMPLEELKKKTKKILTVPSRPFPPDLLNKFENAILNCSEENNQIAIYTKDFNEELINVLKEQEPKALEIIDLELEDIFVQYTKEHISFGSPKA